MVADRQRGSNWCVTRNEVRYKSWFHSKSLFQGIEEIKKKQCLNHGIIELISTKFSSLCTVINIRDKILPKLYALDR